MKIVFISDTHDQHGTMLHPVPDGDILIHAGDATMMGRMNEIAAFGHWFRSLPHKHKVFVPGNHDWMFQRNRTMALSLLNQGLIGNERKDAVLYLEDSMATVEGLRIYGSPWQPTFFDWAFNLDRGEAIKRKWDMIPEGIDILVTHGPPMGVHDQSFPHMPYDKHLGDEELMAAVERVKPKIHVFGHIHGGYGQTQYVNTLFINAAICNEAYKPVNAPIVIELPDGKTETQEEEKEST
jgi:predicted phosphodiesterase